MPREHLSTPLCVHKCKHTKPAHLHELHPRLEGSRQVQVVPAPCHCAGHTRLLLAPLHPSPPRLPSGREVQAGPARRQAVTKLLPLAPLHQPLAPPQQAAPQQPSGSKQSCLLLARQQPGHPAPLPQDHKRQLAIRGVAEARQLRRRALPALHPVRPSREAPGFLLRLPALHRQPPEAPQQCPLPPGVKARPELLVVPALRNSTQPTSHLSAQVNHLLRTTAGRSLS
jgi:hypothetical protein